MAIRALIKTITCSPVLALIWVYQRMISVFIPPSCIYWPSCSEYAKQALRKHGLVGGTYLTVNRLLRCHPFHQGGVDEVPESIHYFGLNKNG